MRYANGRKAKVGDVVKGKGYNIKHEITGLLLSNNPESAGNCTVATVSTTSLIKGICHIENGKFVLNFTIDRKGRKRQPPPEVVATVEYGLLTSFVALDPNTGEILPPD